MSVNRRWRRAQELLEIAEQWPIGEREVRLAKLEPDPALRDEVLDLLDAMDRERRALPIHRLTVEQSAPEFIGPYRVERHGGSGGRGSVYCATREVAGVRQRVAVKILLSHLVTPAALARFEREQRLLASVHHPAVARFLDAGWDENHRPYLVMEWIDGEPIGEYCRHRSLSTHERIRLLIDVLDAVHAAHRSLIVHLDLKPSNILIDTEGRVKLLDFGTAKLLEAEEALTTTRQLTPRYASPEQLRGDAVTTACDIYGAGLTLYEVITGGWPFSDSVSIAALAERAVGNVPLRIATGNSDLDAILHKALHFDARQRYASASDFAADLSAFLDHCPVKARKLTLAYRAACFVGRNRTAVTAGALMTCCLAALGGYAFWQHQQRYAEAARGKEIASFLRGMITSSAVPGSGNSSMTVLDMVARGNEHIERGSVLPPDVAALLQADFAFLMQQAGREDQAEQIARQSLLRAERNAAPEPRIGARQVLAATLLRRGDCPSALALLKEADALLATGGAAAGLSPDYLIVRATANSQCEGNPAGAVRQIERAITLAREDGVRRFSIAPEVFQAGLHLNYALELSRMGRHADARRAADIGLDLAARHEDGRYFHVALLRIRSQAAAVAGNSAEALADIREAIRLAPGVVNLFEQFRLKTLLAGRLADTGQPASAAGLLSETIHEARLRAAEIGPSFWMLLADAAEVHARIGACPQAFALYAEAAALTKDKMPRSWLGNRHFFEAECHSRTDRGRAAASAAKALQAYGDLLPAGSKRRSRLTELMKLP
ncbi:MAG: serine/threonine protein kinase [Acidobacteria bacterium]|nr:serine/threonine protein kinase [Acidobacteriota bacterium]